MTIINPYANLADYIQYTTPRGQSVSSDTNDDATIQEILADVARDIDVLAHRTFYPRYETRYFDVPVYQNSPRNLFLDDDLLEVVTITNGDTTVITPSYYNLKPKNYSPHYAIQLIGPSSIFWMFNNIGSIEKVISVEGWWGYHNRYEQRGWTQVGTLSAAITDTTSTTFSLTAGHTLTTEQIIKIDKEIFNVSSLTALSILSSTNTSPVKITTTTAHGLSGGEQVTVSGHLVNTNANGTWVCAYVSTTEITLTGSVGNGVGGNTGTMLSPALATVFSVNQRGDNGSTAATHLVSAPVYRWNVIPEIREKALMETVKRYQERLGITVTAGGGAGNITTKYKGMDLTGFIRITS